MPVLGGEGKKIGGRRLYSDTGNVCAGEIALTVET